MRRRISVFASSKKSPAEAAPLRPQSRASRVRREGARSIMVGGQQQLKWHR
ncbi:phage DNA packaging protein J [Pseudomonas sp. NPDC088429]|uniref:phage DNA packaging protein J n=1 Tax=Pseudomonas sp. NPDC088429 TaxID=3364455 RepID=UPI003818472B